MTSKPLSLETLDSFVDLFKPSSLTIYSETGSGVEGITGNRYTSWYQVERCARENLRKLGIPTTVVPRDQVENDRKGYHDTPIQGVIQALYYIKEHTTDEDRYYDLRPLHKEIKSLSRDDDKLLERGIRELIQETVTRSENLLELCGKIIQRDYEILENSKDEGCALWLAGCLCCLYGDGGRRARQMAGYFKKKKIGILVPRDHEYLNEASVNRYEINGMTTPSECFLFVVPEIRE